MPSVTLRRHIATGVILVFGPLAPVLFSIPTPAHAEQLPPRLEISGSKAGDRVPFARRGTTATRGAKGPESSGSWWLGTGGIALALAICGGLSVAAKRYRPARHGVSEMRVIGRTSLSPKHSVYLLEVGHRVLILGTGTQGAPSLLGELTEWPDHDGDGDGARDQQRVSARPAVPGGSTVSVSIRPGSTAGRFDRRVGDDE